MTPWAAPRQASLFFTISWTLLKLMSLESVMPSNHLIFYHPLLLLLSVFPSFRVFSNELALRIEWPKYWSLSFNISLSNEFLGLISFRIDCPDFLAVQGTLKSHFQHHSSKATILRCPTFSMVQLSHPYTTTGKTIALTVSCLFVTKGRYIVLLAIKRCSAAASCCHLFQPPSRVSTTCQMNDLGN